jgi:hypothetical protein
VIAEGLCTIFKGFVSDLPGPLVNIVTVTGTDTFGTVVIASASASVAILPTEEQPPQIHLPQVEK